MCAQQRLRSAWASVQSDQSSLCAQWVAKDPSFVHADSEDSETGWMPRLIWVFAGHTCHFVGFVVRRLIWGSTWSWKHFFGHSPSSADSRRAVVSYWQKNVHQVLVNCLGGLPRNSVSGLTDCARNDFKCVVKGRKTEIKPKSFGDPCKSSVLRS